MKNNDTRFSSSQIFAKHDHGKCKTIVVSAVKKVCKDRGLRLTPVREKALRILAESHEALGAYDILSRLVSHGFGAQPPIVYRALDFLIENGFAHRVEKLNAYIACNSPGESHSPLFLICKSCHQVAETGDNMDTRSIHKAASLIKFNVEAASIEIEGFCSGCGTNAQ